MDAKWRFGRERCFRGRRNRVVLTPSRRCQVGEDTSPATVATERGSPGRVRISRKPSRAGMSGNSGGLVVITLVCFFIFARKAAGALGARHSPRPFRAEQKAQPGRNRAAGMRSSYNVIARSASDEAIQLASRRESKLDCFASLAMTVARSRTLSAVVLRESGGPSIPETPVFNPKGRGVLDRPVKPDDDNCGRRGFPLRSLNSYNPPAICFLP